MAGILQTTMAKFRDAARRTTPGGNVVRVVDFPMISGFAWDLQRARIDPHICFAGQNGLGKSMAMLAFMKVHFRNMGMGGNFAEENAAGRLQFMYAYHSRGELEEHIRTKKNCIFGLDESRAWFDYKRHQLSEQNNLYNMLEIARHNANTYVHCTRDYLKLESNLRNGKLQVLIRIWDRVVDENVLLPNGEFKTKYVYAHVYVGNPALELPDKFMQDRIFGNSFHTILHQSEHLPTFVGTMCIGPVEGYGVTDEDLAVYLKNKELGIKNYSNVYGKTRKGRK